MNRIRGVYWFAFFSIGIWAQQPMPQVRVGVEGREFKIPALPRTLAEAKKGAAGVERWASEDLPGLELGIRTMLAAAPTGSHGEAGDSAADPSEAERMRAMEAILLDPTYSILELEVVNTRRIWMRAAGRDPQGRKDGDTSPVSSTKDPTVEEIYRRWKLTIKDPDPFDPEWSAENAKYRQKAEYRLGRIIALRENQQRDQIYRQLAINQVAERECRRLGESWKPLQAHMEASLEKSRHLLIPPPGRESLQHFRMRQKLTVLLMNRWRGCLWFSWLIWAEMAGAPLPPPLKRVEAFLPKAP